MGHAGAGAPVVWWASSLAASAGARGLARARATGTYQRELRFYRDLAPSIAAHCPRPFVAEYEPGTGRFVLMLWTGPPGWWLWSNRAPQLNDIKPYTD
jgi:hypothetical protein